MSYLGATLVGSLQWRADELRRRIESETDPENLKLLREHLAEISREIDDLMKAKE